MRRSLTSWGESIGLAEPLPDGVADLIPTALASVQARLSPVEPKAMAVLMQRLWASGVPQPHPDTIAEWRRMLSPYPEAVLAEAFDQVVRTHRWPDPPKVADVVRFVSDGMERLTRWRAKLEKALLRARMDGRSVADAEQRDRRHAAWEAGLSDDQRRRLEEVRAARAEGRSMAELIGEMR